MKIEENTADHEVDSRATGDATAQEPEITEKKPEVMNSVQVAPGMNAMPTMVTFQSAEPLGDDGN